MLVVTEIRAVELSLICPHCGATQDGWTGDPRGGVMSVMIVTRNTKSTKKPISKCIK